MSDMRHPMTSSPDEQIAAERFEAYRVASARAQQTLDLRDGIAAGHAWSAFLDVFVGDRHASAGSMPGVERRR